MAEVKTLEEKALELIDLAEDSAARHYGNHDVCDELRELIRSLPEDVRMRLLEER